MYNWIVSGNVNWGQKSKEIIYFFANILEKCQLLSIIDDQCQSLGDFLCSNVLFILNQKDFD